MCSIGAVGGTFQNLKLFLTGDLFRGLPSSEAQSAAAYVASLILISSLIGRLLMGWLADHFQKKYVMLLIYLIVGCSIPLLPSSHSPYSFSLCGSSELVGLILYDHSADGGGAFRRTIVGD